MLLLGPSSLSPLALPQRYLLPLQLFSTLLLALSQSDVSARAYTSQSVPFLDPMSAESPTHPIVIYRAMTTGAGSRHRSPWRTRPRSHYAPKSSKGNFLHFVRRPFGQRIVGRLNNDIDGCDLGQKCGMIFSCLMAGGKPVKACSGSLLQYCCDYPSEKIIQPPVFGPVKNDPYCGRSAGRVSRIVGGNDAEFGEFPWQAFILVAGSRCGGALVGRQHVVTAGHCVAKAKSPDSIKVILGDLVLNSDIEELSHEEFNVLQIRVHPNFQFTPQADRYDVAILVLDRPVQYRENIMPICLPEKGADFTGRTATVAGWGAIEPGSKLRPRTLQNVQVPVMRNEQCERWHRRQGINLRIHAEMMCAGYEFGGRDSCQGDSGGPLMFSDNGVWYLIGVVSAGYSCAKQYQPGIYHRVASSSDWISANVFS
ncbi:serine proteinase stubble-like [Tropilaelaps mercedesae]|uniref:Serine proteinase stubble-like n=1 Tax=Tropilaelaps mercedesae TaxID=418985 RepID=A0A1V9X944_9ACAR|nr:serine proteinase stubble-like [Tropilaelaps mercedesae]